MKISDIMKRDVVSVTASATIGQAVDLFVARRIGTLPVVDEANRLVGMLLLSDVLELVMPDFVRMIEDLDFVHDFGAVETQKPSQAILARSTAAVMKKPVSVEETAGLLRAVAMLRQHNLRDLPIVADDGRLVGIASRVDVGAALLVSWGISRSSNTTATGGT